MAEEHEFVEGDPFDPEYVSAYDKANVEAARAIDQSVVDLLRVRQEAYRRMFNGADAETRRIVLADLNAFCRGTQTPFHENDRIHCVLTGRNEVYKRIADHLRLSLDALVQQYTQPKD